MKTVLFVDDNQTLSRLSCDILRRQGYRAIPAFSAVEALEAFERDDFDLVVTDLRMENMDGLELARAIRERDPNMPIIMVTAYGPVKGEHIDVCLPKDGLFPALLEQIKLCLAMAEARRRQPA
jgi:two-component system, NtrC family, response regulator